MIGFASLGQLWRAMQVSYGTEVGALAVGGVRAQRADILPMGPDMWADAVYLDVHGSR